eukprot:77207-Rhodomonas_salina.1
MLAALSQYAHPELLPGFQHADPERLPGSQVCFDNASAARGPSAHGQDGAQDSGEGRLHAGWARFFESRLVAGAG